LLGNKETNECMPEQMDGHTGVTAELPSTYIQMSGVQRFS